MKSIIKFYVLGASENICKWILMIFFERLCFEKRENINVFRKKIKLKVAIRMHYSETEIDIPPKITLQLEFFLWSPSSLVLLKDFLKICRINSLSTMKYS